MKEKNQIPLIPGSYVTVPIGANLFQSLRMLMEGWRRFTQLPEDFKIPYLFVSGQGGFETSGGRTDAKETLEIRRSHISTLLKQMPTDPMTEKTLFENVDEFLLVVEPVVRRVMEALGMKSLIPAALENKMHWMLRLLYYPQRSPNDTLSPLALPHPDLGGITIHLLETMGGLEVKVGTDWTPAHAPSQHVLGYPGLTGQYLTQGKVKASCHQVTALPQITTSPRYCIILFVDFAGIAYDKENGKSVRDIFGQGENYAMNHRVFTSYFKSD